MVILSLTASAAESGLILGELSEYDIEGIHENDLPDAQVRLDIFVRDAVEAGRISARFPALASSVSAADSRDWVAHSRRFWNSLEVGERFFLAPEWDDGAVAPEGRILLRMPAGQGFGSGLHETTQLALRALETVSVEDLRVLDVGTGSGILLAAAERLGAAALVGCDLDPVAIEAARAYLAGLAISPKLFQGSINAVRVHRFPVILANLNATLILNLLEPLLGALEPGGTLILSGILAGEAATIRAAFERMPRIVQIYHSAQGDWVNFRLTTGS